VPPLQQPFGHVLLSHAHAPMVLSQSLVVQLVQAFPPLPHCEADSDPSGTQVPPLQQPLGQDAGSHTHEPALHSWPGAHAPHAAPPVPHAPLFSAVMHCPETSQQPVGHEVASQTHCPAPLHSWPDAHAPHSAPPFPHEPADSPDSGSHAPPAVQQPVQDKPLQVHAPSVHASPDAQEPQAAPPAPHSVSFWVPKGTQFPVGSQQPFAHELASHTHWPLLRLHSWPEAHDEQVAPPVPHDAGDCEP
jgi:hypothetical protein